MQPFLEIIDSFWTGLQSGQLPPLGNWGYLLLAIVVMIEGPIATLLGAAAASTGLMKPGMVFVAASAGNLAADSLWYSVGYAGKGDWLVRHAGWLGLRQRHMERLERQMHTHANKVILAAKLTAGLMIPTLIAAGMARVPLRRWFGVVFAAECLWTGALVLAGFYLTDSITKIEQGIGYLAGTVTVVVLMALGFSIIKRAMRRAAPTLPASEDETPTD